MICPICKSDKIKYYSQKNGHKLYECKVCDLLFVWPVPQNLSEIYGESYFKAGNEKKEFGYVNYDDDKKAMRSTFIEYLKIIENLSPIKKIFDVGAATGYFLNLARERGWQTAGAEISEYAGEAARARGHNVVNRLEGLEFKEEFDAVTMWDVLEHLNDPANYLVVVKKILKVNGLLVINTVDRGSYWARICGKRWPLILPPEHLFYFSKKNLDLLLADNGFEILSTKKIGKRFTVSYVFKILYNWQHLEIWRKLSQWFTHGIWQKATVHINLKDNLFIIAKKIKNV